MTRRPTPRSGEPAGKAAEAPLIGIQIERLVPSAVVHGRRDFLIRGRVIATRPIEEVELLTDGGRVGQMRFAPTEQAFGVTLPDGTAAGQHNFVFQLATPEAADVARIDFVIVARTIDDRGAQAAFVLEADPQQSGPAAIVSGPAEDGASVGGSPPAALLYAERACIDPDGNLFVHGWAVSRDSLAGIEVAVDETPVGAAATGGARADVAGVHRAYPNAAASGFTLSLPIGALADRAMSLLVDARTAGGTALATVLPVELVGREEVAARAAEIAQVMPDPSPTEATGGSVAPDDPRRTIVMYGDEATLGTDGVISVKGWVVSATGIAGLTVLLDGEKVGEAELGQPRLDVGDAFPEIPAARYAGFRLRAKALASASGKHVVTLLARNGLGDMRQARIDVDAQPTVRGVIAPKFRPPASPAAGSKAFEFRLDSPAVSDGAMTRPVTGDLTLEGWVLGRRGIADVEVLLDDATVGTAHYGVVRRDIAAMFPDREDALRCGFGFAFPVRSLTDGEHAVTLRIKGKDGETLIETFRITVDRVAAGAAGIRQRMPQAEAALYADILGRLDWQPEFCVVLRDADARSPERLARTLGSLERQVYPHWRAILPDDDPALRRTVAALVAAGRVGMQRIGFQPRSAHGFEAVAEGPVGVVRLIGVLCSGDVLGCDALAEFAVASGLHRDAALLYADEVRVDPASGERAAFCKPGFSPDLLLSTNYIGRPWFATAALLDEAGVSPHTVDTGGDYDALLRCAEVAGPGGIHAVPRLLAERGSGGDTAETEARALAAAVQRRGIAASVEPGCLPGIWRVRRQLNTASKVSVVVATAAADGLVRTCLALLRQGTAYRAIEVIAVDTIPAEMAKDKAWLRKAADKVIEAEDGDGDGAFNWPRLVNRAAAAAQGAFLLFLDDDIVVSRPDWLDAMLEHAQRPEVGVVGPQLLYPDGRVQHAGLFLGQDGTARHAFRFAAGAEPGSFGLARTQRNVIAVTGACMLMRRETFAALGGFDETYATANADVAFCLRAHAADLLTVYTPYASLIHREQASRAALPQTYDPARFAAARAACVAEGDPYSSPNLSRPGDEPPRLVVGGHPLFRAEDIRRILVVKVDEVGTVVTALPAIRRLKAHFPAARIVLLTSPVACGFAALEPAIAEAIPFNLVRGRPALRQRAEEPEEMAALTSRLAPYGFNLAIDLHKGPETRTLLHCAGAPVLAGFDQAGRFPWLDVALEWEGERKLAAKRFHVTDDLLHLVDAVATAAATDRTGIRPDALAALRSRADLPDEVRRFLGEPTVCVQPGAGSGMRQWPLAHFATLIDLLTTRDNLRVVLIGGPGETEFAERILGGVTRREQVMSLVGKLPLDVQPAVIAACALFVGNDGGLKHVAAALGTPTVGVHSAVVDPAEWAPAGPRAVAVARAMSCGPCYLTRAEDCPRDLACLRDLPPLSVHRICEMLLARRVPAGSGQAAPAPAIDGGAAAIGAQGRSAQRTLSTARQAQRG